MIKFFLKSFFAATFIVIFGSPLFAATFDRDIGFTGMDIRVQHNVAFAQAGGGDLSIQEDDVRIPMEVLPNKTVRIYVIVHNNSNVDLAGIVKFFDETNQQFIGTDQPVSVLAKKTDDVFADWTPTNLGEVRVAVRVIPWTEEGDDPSNNKVIRTFYVDHDSDGDGMGDRNDPDDDNDGVPDSRDAFPLDSSESSDFDEDGIGDNTDTDDDDDGVSDIVDIFPLNAGESEDRDGDGIGDNADLFPDDPTEWDDSDGDGVGNNADPNNQNHSPIPRIETQKTNVSKGEIITFNGLWSRDPDGQIETYEWDFGDGVFQNGVVVDHIYKDAGSYTVVLKLTDDKGESREEVFEITVGRPWYTLLLWAVFLAAIILIGYGLYYKKDQKKK